jgi:hypothetical protein
VGEFFSGCVHGSNPKQTWCRFLRLFPCSLNSKIAAPKACPSIFDTDRFVLKQSTKRSQIRAESFWGVELTRARWIQTLGDPLFRILTTPEKSALEAKKHQFAVSDCESIRAAVDSRLEKQGVSEVHGRQIFTADAGRLLPDRGFRTA